LIDGFTGRVNWIQLDDDYAAAEPDHQIDPAERHGQHRQRHPRRSQLPDKGLQGLKLSYKAHSSLSS
jgi:hypothetical protein